MRKKKVVPKFDLCPYRDWCWNYYNAHKDEARMLDVERPLDKPCGFEPIGMLENCKLYRRLSRENE